MYQQQDTTTERLTWKNIRSSFQILHVEQRPGKCLRVNVHDNELLEQEMALSPARRMAVCCCTHERLGAKSPFRFITQDLVKHICSLALPTGPLDMTTEYISPPRHYIMDCIVCDDEAYECQFPSYKGLGVTFDAELKKYKLEPTPTPCNTQTTCNNLWRCFLARMTMSRPRIAKCKSTHARIMFCLVRATVRVTRCLFTALTGVWNAYVLFLLLRRGNNTAARDCAFDVAKRVTNMLFVHCDAKSTLNLLHSMFLCASASLVVEKKHASLYDMRISDEQKCRTSLRECRKRLKSVSETPSWEESICMKNIRMARIQNREMMLVDELNEAIDNVHDVYVSIEQQLAMDVGTYPRMRKQIAYEVSCCSSLLQTSDKGAVSHRAKKRKLHK